MKNILMLLMVAIGWSSCSNDTATKAPAKKEGATNKNIELVNQYFEHFNKHEWKEMVEMYIEVADFKDPSLGIGMVKQTRLATSAVFQEMVMEYPDLKREVLKTYSTDYNTVVVELISTGTAKDGTKMKLPMRSIFTFKNGKITMDISEYEK